MGVGFFPSTDSGLSEWAKLFASGLLADGPSLGVSVEQAQAFADLQARWQAAYEVAIATQTRTRGAVAAKNEAREAMKLAASRLANVVYGQADVTPAQLINLGLTVDAARSIRGAPSQPPTLGVALRDGRTVTLTIAQNEGGRRGRLPDGVSGAVLFRSVGDAPATTMTGWQFVGLTGRLTLDVSFDEAVPPGAQVWFTAAWFSHRKELSPLADARSIHLAGPALVHPAAMMRRAA